MSPILVLPLLWVLGCAETGTTYSESLSSEGVWDVFCDIERGDFLYSGFAEDEVFDVSVRTWGRGGGENKADARQANTEWGAQVSNGLLNLWGRAPVRKSGTDISVVGPQVINVEAVLLDGVARLEDVDGFHLVTANRVEGTRVIGDVDLVATLDGVDIDVHPYDGSLIRIDAVGDVILLLPWGLEYSLEVFPDPAYGAEVVDLGFESLFFAPDYVSALTGSGAIRVEVSVFGGTFFLWEAAPLTQ